MEVCIGVRKNRRENRRGEEIRLPCRGTVHAVLLTLSSCQLVAVHHVHHSMLLLLCSGMLLQCRVAVKALCTRSGTGSATITAAFPGYPGSRGLCLEQGYIYVCTARGRADPDSTMERASQQCCSGSGRGVQLWATSRCKPGGLHRLAAAASGRHPSAR